MFEELKKFREKVLKEIEKSQDLEFLEEIWRKYLGRKGKLREYSLKLKNLSDKERARFGKLINDIKQETETAIADKKNQLINLQTCKPETIDVTLPGKKLEYGHLHPHSQMKYQVAEIFHSMGFEILEGPEVENDYYNFESLNIPEGHPARDMWDTFYVKSEIRNPKSETNSKLLLRTHTSAMQVRVMEKKKPPLKICVIGKCYRHEATDASHEHTLYQIEGFAVDEQISVANLIYTLKSFLTVLFGQEVKVRLRPSYFPFTEPSFEMDFGCLNCGGRGCPACGGTGWVEMLGCGMIHPKVFEYAGYPKGVYTGFAFGVGLDRLVMMRHKIDDIRWFHGGDLRFLQQF
ncbi:MAG: phenylalanine--tRNA ligase subunit alpha [Patescibacteria group bacterium]